jgi:hAT family C-terminal dimerisation region
MNSVHVLFISLVLILDDFLSQSAMIEGEMEIIDDEKSENSTTIVFCNQLQKYAEFYYVDNIQYDNTNNPIDSSTLINSQNDSNLSLLNDYFADKNVNISIFENRKYAKLRDIFIDLNSKISSSASVERIFSTAKKVWTCDRSKIADKILEEMIFLKCNSQIDC